MRPARIPADRRGDYHKGERANIAADGAVAFRLCVETTKVRRSDGSGTIGAMQWLIHGDLTPAVGEALRRLGHVPHTIAELGVPAEPTFRDIIWTSNKKQWDIVTHDAALVQWVYDDGFPFQRSLVFLQLEGGEVEQDAAIMRLFERYKRLTPGRMYTVTGSRVKIRQLPTGPRGKAPPGEE